MFICLQSPAVLLIIRDLEIEFYAFYGQVTIFLLCLVPIRCSDVSSFSATKKSLDFRRRFPNFRDLGIALEFYQQCFRETLCQFRGKAFKISLNFSWTNPYLSHPTLPSVIWSWVKFACLLSDHGCTRILYSLDCMCILVHVLCTRYVLTRHPYNSSKMFYPP